MSKLLNKDVMAILESIGQDWAVGKDDAAVDAVVDYLNMVCCDWMGGDWGLRRKHLRDRGPLCPTP